MWNPLYVRFLVSTKYHAIRFQDDTAHHRSSEWAGSTQPFDGFQSSNRQSVRHDFDGSEPAFHLKKGKGRNATNGIKS